MQIAQIRIIMLVRVELVTLAQQFDALAASLGRCAVAAVYHSGGSDGGGSWRTRPATCTNYAVNCIQIELFGPSGPIATAHNHSCCLRANGPCIADKQ
ncbi:unnamed protein product [Ceratitis capitata]|uniref:(Mediterranean fruit fly) hypothetical protein n=1 Tax=Ceratitis capitata TaxID=7213 RepID=A0A811U7H6_CERCA|nr:unnamed protein product [Ceratitis capitata]